LSKILGLFSRQAPRARQAPRESLVKGFRGFEVNRFPRERSLVGDSVEHVFGPEGSSPIREGQGTGLAEEKEDERFKREAERMHEEAQGCLKEAKAALAQARERAQVIAEDARKSAAAMVEDARRRTEQIEAEAYQAGFEQGEEAGRLLSEQKTESVIRSLRQVIEEAAAQRSDLLSQSEQDLVKLAFLISLQVLQREIRQDPSVVLDVARAALKKAKRTSRLILFVSPHDFRFVEEHLDQLQSPSGVGAEIKVEPDPDLARGGCRIQCDCGEVDASIEVMIDNLRTRVWAQE